MSRLGLNITKKTEHEGSHIEIVMKNRGIEDIQKFSKAELDESTDHDSFKGMHEGMLMICEAIDNDQEITILVDQDADGFSSAAMMYRYLMLLGIDLEIEPKLKFYVAEEKTHGLTAETQGNLLKQQPDLLIIPDAGSNDFRQCEELIENGTKIVIIDHHEVDDQNRAENMRSENYQIINNHLDSNENTNHTFVGCGMVYKVCESLDEAFGKTIAPDNLKELFAIGQTGDASDVSQMEIRSTLVDGLTNIKHPFLKEILKDEMDREIGPMKLSFSIIPLINAVARVGKLDEKEEMFRCLAGVYNEDDTTAVIRRRKNQATQKMESVELHWSYYTLQADLAAKIKGRQNSMIKKVQSILPEKMINTEGITIVVLTEEEIKNRSITGLVANKLVNQFQQPALILVESDDGKVIAGSARGHEKTLKDFRGWCNDTNQVIYAQGHAGAFGIAIEVDKIESFIECAKRVESEEIIYESDIVVHGTVDLAPVKELNEYAHLFGGKVNEARIAFVGAPIPKRFISKRGSMLKLFSNGLEFVMYSCPEELFDEIQSGFASDITFDIVGRPSLNNWGGTLTDQLVIEDICIADKVEVIEEESEEINVDNIVF